MTRPLMLMMALTYSACFVPALEEPAPGGDAGTVRDAGSTGDAGTPGDGGVVGACASDLSCAVGSVCEGCPGGATECTPGCRDHAQCPPAQHCQLGAACFTCPCPPGTCVAGPPPAPTSTGVVFHDCAPWDGPAFAFQLGAGAVCPPAASSASLVVSLWLGVLEPGSWNLTPGFNGPGNAQLCGAQECFLSDSGTFTITAVTGTVVEGRYDLHFQNVPARVGTFRVDRCVQDGGFITRCG